MKKLIILRHAKSSWDNPELRDINRPLTNKGKRRTQLIADYMIANKIIPEFIASSPAVRAFETAKIVAMGFDLKTDEIRIDPELYFVDVEKYFHAVFAAPDNCNSMLIVGHNPMITEFCNSFLKDRIDNLPTSGLCVISSKADKWNEISIEEYTVEHLVFPKKLEQL
jgi:phosphohistidine phosphatase